MVRILQTDVKTQISKSKYDSIKREKKNEKSSDLETREVLSPRRDEYVKGTITALKGRTKIKERTAVLNNE